MTLLVSFSLPFQDPVLIFSLLLLVILTIPFLFQRLGLPTVVGLIVTGILVGPHGLGLLQRDNSMILFGTFGLLYIMFLAGLELDWEEFSRNKHRSIQFGILTFAFPILLGFPACYYGLSLGLIPSLLVASMFATHTLISYQIVSRLGLTRTEVVTVAVGGTIITDSAVLLVLSILTSAYQGELSWIFWVKMSISLVLFATALLWGLPQVAQWFFRVVQAESAPQFVFVLSMMFLSGFLAELAGVEPIIGAFLSGLALNRLIPHHSVLMNRIEFVGNALFIPIFLISVGMLVDLSVLFDGPEALIFATVLTGVAIVGKWVAAWAAQMLFGYNATQRTLLFGLSSSHAAATIAVIMIGFNLGMFDEKVLNGTILLILVTCLLSSFMTENAAKTMVIMGADRAEPPTAMRPERILVPIANPANAARLLEVAFMLRDPKGKFPVFPLMIVKDNQEAEDRIRSYQQSMTKLMKEHLALGIPIQPVTKIDPSNSLGIVRASRELLISMLVMGWHTKIQTADRLFGTALDKVLERSGEMIVVSHVFAPINTFSRVELILPMYAEVEKGFHRILDKALLLANQISAKLSFHLHPDTWKPVEQYFSTKKISSDAGFQYFEDWGNLPDMAAKTKPTTLLMIVSARRGAASHHHDMDNLPALLNEHFAQHHFFLIYPEQYED